MTAGNCLGVRKMINLTFFFCFIIAIFFIPAVSAVYSTPPTEQEVRSQWQGYSTWLSKAVFQGYAYTDTLVPVGTPAEKIAWCAALNKSLTSQQTNATLDLAGTGYIKGLEDRLTPMYGGKNYAVYFDYNPQCSDNPYGHYWWIGYNRSTPPLVAGFSATPLNGTVPLTVAFVDQSTGPVVTKWFWSFGDGNTSSSSSPTHTYSTAGIYSVSLVVNSSMLQNSTTKTNYITVKPSDVSILHLDLDVKEQNSGAYIPSSLIGIYDPVNNQWRNSTCETGACGFMDSGLNHQDPLVFGRTYTLAASHPDYLPQSQNVEFTYDHQLVTLYLPYRESNVTNITDLRHLDVDIKSTQSNNYLQNTNYQIYDYFYDQWRNSTCSNGACGWTRTGPSGEHNLVYGHQYGLYADKFGYLPTNQTVILSYDHQLFTLWLTPETVYNETNHMSIDVKFPDNETYVTNTNLNLFDPSYNTWYNTTCINGACGFINSNIGRPIQYGHTYNLVVTKPGFYDSIQAVTLSFDYQLFTIRLMPLSYFQTTITDASYPSYSIPVFPTVTGTLAPNTSFIINTTIPQLNITLPSTLPPIPSYLNSTYMRNDLISKFSPITPLLNLIDGLMGYLFFFLTFFSSMFLGPFLYIFSANNSIMSLLFYYLGSWTVMAAPIVWVIGVTGNMLGPKVESCIIIAMILDTILQIRDTIGRN